MLHHGSCSTLYTSYIQKYVSHHPTFTFTSQFNVGFIHSYGHTSDVPQVTAIRPTKGRGKERRLQREKSEVKIHKEEDEEQTTMVEINEFQEQNGKRGKT